MKLPNNLLTFLLKIQLLSLINTLKGEDDWNYSDEVGGELEQEFFTSPYRNHWRLPDLNETNFHSNRHKRFAPLRVNDDLFGKLDKEQTPDAWQVEVWDMHNKLRKLHGIEEDLILDGELAVEAQEWAEELAKMSAAAGKVILKHQHEYKHDHAHGEALGGRMKQSHAELASLPGSFPVRSWYAERANHNWEENYWHWSSGHFSQLVWAASKRIGCGRFITETNPFEDCKDGKLIKHAVMIIVCRYDPAGNWLSHAAFNSHVHKPTDGDPNAVPDFTQFCPDGTSACSKPYVCCKDGVVPKIITCNGTVVIGPKGRSAKPVASKPKSKAAKPQGRNAKPVTPKPKSKEAKPQGRNAKVVAPKPKSKETKPQGRNAKPVTPKPKSKEAKPQGRNAKVVAPKPKSKEAKPQGRNAKPVTTKPKSKETKPQGRNAKVVAHTPKPVIPKPKSKETKPQGRNAKPVTPKVKPKEIKPEGRNALKLKPTRTVAPIPIKPTDMKSKGRSASPSVPEPKPKATPKPPPAPKIQVKKQDVKN